jgi:hypothetical protein
MEQIDNLINKYIEHYRKTFPEINVKNMFDKINFEDPSSTNHIMEMFYTDLLKHKKINNDIYTDVSDINIDKVDNLYSLKVNGDIKYISQSIISLLYVVVDNKYTDWFIFNLK